MIRRARWLALGACIAVAVATLGATTGGFPSRPTFQSVGINTAASTAGQLRLKSSAGANTQVLLQGAGGSNQIGLCMSDTAAQCFNTATAGQGLLFTNNSNGLFISNDNGVTAQRLSGPIICTTACTATGMAVGQSAQVIKTGNTSRQSTTTLATDPDLQFSLSNGTYRFEIHAEWTSVSGGFSWGATASGGYQVVGVVACQAIGVAAQQNSSTCATTSGGGDLTVSGEAVVSGIATVGFQWAQQTSSATNTTLGPNSYVTVTRLN
jgi:hypothetical protein